MTREDEKIKQALIGVVDAWESIVPGTYAGHSGMREMQAWLSERMRPAISAARAALGREVPK